MAEERARPGTPAWKQAVPQKGRKDSARPAWRREPEAAPAPRPAWKRRTKLGFGGLGLMVGTAALVWVIYWLFPHKPACLVLLGADYVLTGDGKGINLAIPHNAYGWQSLKALQDTTADVVNVKHAPNELRLDTKWDQDLDTVKEKTIILYLAVHGGADADGPYLLPQDAGLGDPEHRLHVTKILERLESLPAKKKVLLLDATQVPANWTLGMLHNDFARALQDGKIADRIKAIPNLVVLCASGPDQRSWISQEWRTTAFAHFVREGLRGAADGHGGRKDGRVTALELHTYVAERVKAWVHATYGQLQMPILLGGEDRARDIELANVRSYAPLNPAEAPARQAPVDLARIEKAWQDCEELQNRNLASPVAYSPHLWRQYLDSLLLYEQLLRAGYEEKLAGVKDQIDKLHDTIDGAVRLSLPSAQNAVSMPRALGLGSAWPDGAVASRKLLDLRDAPPGRQVKLWEQLSNEVQEAGGGRAAAARLSGLLVELLAKGNLEPDELDKAHKLLEIMKATGNARAAEVHFLAMLSRDLDRQALPPGSRLREALALRRLAEDSALAVVPERPVHPYSERIFPWISDKINQADASRQQGQDLLFATEPEAWDRAGQWFAKARDGTQAGEGYRAARDDAQRVQEALALGHRVFAILPYYSHWLADMGRADETRVEAVRKLWVESHNLMRMLRGDFSSGQARLEWIRTPQSVAPGDPSPRSLVERTRLVGDSLKALEDQFVELCKRLEEPPAAELQGSWRQIEEVLAVPTIKAEVRMPLIREAVRIAHDFHEKTVDESKVPAGEVSGEENRKEACGRAGRQGLLALAVLGESWFEDAGSFKANEPYGKVLGQVKDLTPEVNWQERVQKAGQEVAARWRHLPDQINALTEEGRTRSAKQAEPVLARAEDLARLLEGGLVPYLSHDPVDASRRLRFHNLLLWQAERTLHDHWFAEDPRDRPYYQYAADLYVRDAEALILGGQRGALTTAQSKELLQDVERVNGQLTKTELEPVLQASGRPEITSENQLALAYQLKPRGWLPAGFPVAWLKDDALLHLREGAGKGRHVLELKGTGPTAAEAFALEPAPPAPPARSPRRDVATVQLQALYRGQVINLPTAVNIHRLPDLVHEERPGPLRAAVAVRADTDLHAQYAPEKGSLSIVLDCTGSMYEQYENHRKNFEKNGVPIPPFTPQTPCKWHEATNALRQVLKDMQPGTTVSIWVFGHARGRIKERRYPVDDQPDPRKEPLRTIQQFRKPSGWKREQLDDLMSELEDLFPFNETPLLRAMVEAKNTDFSDNIKGFKSLLVLTDGEDNCFQYDKELHERHSTSEIEQFLYKEFEGSGIRPILVGFKVPAEEQAQLQKFKRGLEKLSLKGRYFEVEDAKKLGATLRTYMKQELRFQIEHEDGTSAAPELLQANQENGFGISTPVEGDKPVYLKRGTYRVRVQLQKPLEKRIELEDGDFLRLKLTPSGIGRVPLGPDYPDKFHREIQSWLLTVPQNRLKSPENDLEMMLTMDDLELAGPTLKQIKPGRLWLQVKAQDVGRLVGLRWGALPGYGAPAWDLHVAEWPSRPGAAEPARPVVQLWWNPSSKLAGSAGSISRDLNADLSNFSGKELPIGADAADKVHVESVQVEQREVPGETGKVPALVVRLRYPPGKPAWVDIVGPEHVGGVEHRFYTEAGKYAGIFWPVPEAAAKDHLKALQVYALDLLQKDKATIAAELKVESSPDNRGRDPSIFDVK